VTDAGEAPALVAAIRSGDVAAIRKLLAEHPGLASAPLGGSTQTAQRLSPEAALTRATDPRHV